jgi:hypothetical protein
MYRNILKSISCILMCLFLMSCGTSLKSNHYVGVKEPIDEKELNKESIWTIEDSIFYARAVDPNKIIASSLRWDEAEKEYKVETFQIVFTSLGKYAFLNLPDKDTGLYTIYRLVPSTDGSVILFAADKENMKKHIKEGKIKAIEKDGSFILETTKEGLDKYVLDNLNEIFDYSSANIIKPLKGFKDNKQKQ